jgi:hypothetical protein
LGRRAPADVCEVLSHSHFSKKYRAFENVIAWCAAPIAPFPLDVVGDVIGADLLTVAINASVRGVHTFTALEHAGLRLGINVCSFLIGLGIEMTDLPIRDDREPHPRKGKSAENSKKEWSEAFHQCADGSASTGFRKVGTVDVRPNPNSIRPK